MTKHETEIVADEKSPTIEIIRKFDAPAEQVFRAHVDPELYGRWGRAALGHHEDHPVECAHRRRVGLRQRAGR